MFQQKNIRRRPRGFAKRLISGIAVLAMSLGLVSLTASAASAAPEDALSATLIKPDGTPVQPGEVIAEGTQLKLRVQYQKQAAPNDLTGTTHQISLGSNVTVGAPPAGNTAVTGISSIVNGIEITFADPWPGDVNQGYLDLDFTVNDVNSSGVEEVTWEVGGKPGSLQIVVKNDGDEFENIGSESFDKGVSSGGINSHVEVGEDPANPGEVVFLGLDPAIIGTPVTYTLTVELPKGSTGTDFDISDQLPAGLNYVAGSFTSTLTEWDADGRNQTVTVLDGTTSPTSFDPTVSSAADPTAAGESFAGQIDLPTPSVLTVTYQAVVPDEASRLLLEDALRASAAALGGNSGGFSHALTNTAKFGPGEVEATATVTLSGTIPGPCTTGCGGAAFGKSGAGASVNVIADGDGVIVDESGNPTPVDTTYTLAANLSQWDGRNNNYTLDRNVVISDTLGSQLTWKTGDADFLTLTAIPEATTPITSLTEVACPVDAATDPIATASSNFNGDAFVGKYCIDGQRLLVNIGKHVDTNVSIAIKAQLHRVDGLVEVGGSTVLGGKRYALPNQAQFWHRNGARANADHTQYPVKLPDDRSGGINDTAAFTKQGPSGAISVNPGERAVVPYVFTVDTAVAGVSAADARIEDRIDTSVFDLSDLGQVGVSSTYDGVDVSGDVELGFADGVLTIELADGSALPADGTWIVTLQIPTHPLEGKETIDITNYASLFGTGTEPWYWSEDDSRATSFGDELEVRKHIYDRGASDWNKVLVAPVDEHGALVEEVYVYRLQLIAHGSFAGAILAVQDVLPAETEFLGFVDEADVATGGPVLPSATVALGHGIEAVYDGSSGPQGEITVHQASGSLPVGGEVAAYFAVKIDRDAPETVVNSFGGQDASLVPGGPSIDIEKWIDEGAAPTYDGRGRLLNDGFAGDYDAAPGKKLTAGQPEKIRFTVSNDGPEDLIDIVVSDELASGTGKITDLVCTFVAGGGGAAPVTGTEWAGPLAPGERFECEGTLPALTAGATHANVASVTAVGAVSGLKVQDADEWHAHVPAAPLVNTGGQTLFGAALLGGLGVLAGGLLLLRRRRHLG